MLKFTILILTLFHSAFICAAEVYQQTDSQGNTVYSDTPLDPDAKKLSVPSRNSVSTPSTTTTEVTKITTTTTDTPVPTKISETTPDTLGTTKTPETAPVVTAIVDEKNKVFLIESPKDQDTIYNQPTIPVKIQISPELKKGEKIALLLDGKPAGVPTAGTLLELANVDRGTHQLSAALVDDKGQVIKQANSVTIYVHRTSINNIINSPR